MNSWVMATRICEDISTLIHYMEMTNHGTHVHPIRCESHEDCAVTLCGLHSDHGTVVREEVDCIDCVMEQISRTDLEVKEKVTA